MKMKFVMNGFAAAAVAVFVTAASAAAPKSEGKLKLPTIAYETYTLPNGLQVITHEDHRLPLVAVDLWYHVGPLNERPAGPASRISSST